MKPRRLRCMICSYAEGAKEGLGSKPDADVEVRILDRISKVCTPAKKRQSVATPALAATPASVRRGSVRSLTTPYSINMRTAAR
eukprot:scaffold60891_cov44-Prasinocladus_malaysianus.AAC.3